MDGWSSAIPSTMKMAGNLWFSKVSCVFSCMERWKDRKKWCDTQGKRGFFRMDGWRSAIPSRWLSVVVVVPNIGYINAGLRDQILAGKCLTRYAKSTFRFFGGRFHLLRVTLLFKITIITLTKLCVTNFFSRRGWSNLEENREENEKRQENPPLPMTERALHKHRTFRWKETNESVNSSFLVTTNRNLESSLS